jgi:hypothetical protein
MVSSGLSASVLGRWSARTQTKSINVATIESPLMLDAGSAS